MICSLVKQRLSLVLLFCMLSVSSYSQLSFSVYVDGQWGDWFDGYYNSGVKHSTSITFSGNRANFILYNEYTHPSNWAFHVYIPNYNADPSDDAIKYCIKKGVPLEYKGVVEYYVSEEYPNIRKYLLEFYNYRCLPVVYKHKTLRRTNATIKIYHHKWNSKIYNVTFNVFFDDVGLAVSRVLFKKEKK